MARWMEMPLKFYQRMLSSTIMAGAVVLMDNVPAHKISSIETLIQSTGANVLYYPLFPDFNPIEHWWSQESFYVSSPQPQLKWLIL